MADPNVLGQVVAYRSDCIDPEESPKCEIQVILRNTLGQTKTVWLAVPVEVDRFFSCSGDL